MFSTLKIPVLALILGTAFVSVETTRIDPPKRSACDQWPVKTFNPLVQPKDSMARAPFLDPTALFSDRVYLVQAIESEDADIARNARFVGGEQALVGHLKAQVLQHIAPGIGWLKPPVVQFSVDASGAPTEIDLMNTSGNADLDEALVRIFNEMPRWEPATKLNDHAVPQRFQFSIGPGGC